MWNFARIRLGGSLWVMRLRPMRSGIDLCCRERNWESHGNASYEDYQRLSEHLRTLTEKINCMSRRLFAQPHLLTLRRANPYARLDRRRTGGGKRYSTKSPLA